MLCTDPFKNLSINVSSNGKLNIAPCCTADSWEVDSYDFYNDPKLNEIRTAILAGEKHPGCNSCWKKDELGIRSRRIMVTEQAIREGYHNSKVELIKLDYWVGNICNLACVICSPVNSSRWHADAVALGHNQNMLKIVTTPHWKELPDSIIDIHFNGGEPLLSKDHFNFLTGIKNKSQVLLTYNTNGTVIPSDEVVKLWQQFKKVILSISFDDIQDRFEYQRYPLNWQNFKQNMEIYKSLGPNIFVTTFSTIGLLNVFSFPETYKWFKENFSITAFGNEIVNDTHFAHGITNCETMPIRYKPILEELYKDMPEGLNFSKFVNYSDIEIKSELYTYLNNLDKIRNLDYKKVFPYLT